MKRVLIIAPQPFYVDRGTPINVRAVALSLVELGYDVHLLAFPHGRDIELPGVTVYRCPKLPFVKNVPIGLSWQKVLYDLFLFGMGLRLLASKPFFLAQGIEDGAIIAGILGRLTAVPFIFDMDSCMVSGVQETCAGKFPRLIGLVEKIERFFLKRAIAVITVSNSLTRKVKSISDAIPVFQINDFPVGCGEASSEEEVRALRERLGLKDAAAYIYTGNLEAYQGIDLLIDSFAGLLQQPDLPARRPKLVIVGGDAVRIDLLHAKCRDLGIAGSVLFTGPRPLAEMQLYLDAADVLVSPRLIGGNTPLKLYSYMASGKPVAATAIESHTAVLTDECAFLGAPTPDEFAAALKSAGSDPAEAQRRAANAKALVEACYSEKKFKEQLTEVYAFVECEVERRTPPSKQVIPAAS